MKQSQFKLIRYGGHFIQPLNNQEYLQCFERFTLLLLLFNAGFISHKAGWRKTMEDTAIYDIDLDDGNSVFGVFDGHGGHQVSQYVAQIFISILKSTEQYVKKDYIEAFQVTFKRIDQLIDSKQGNQRLKQIRGKDQLEQNTDLKISNTTGCTANVLLITPDKLVTANAGKNRSCLCRNGLAHDLSEDHYPQDIIERTRIQKAGGVVQMGRVNGGLNQSRAFGSFDYKKQKRLPYDQQMITCKPDISQIERSSQDEFIILGSDGIWQNYMENSQGLLSIIKGSLKKDKQLKQTVEDLLDNLLGKDQRFWIGCDNMTAILIKLK